MWAVISGLPDWTENLQLRRRFLGWLIDEDKISHSRAKLGYDGFI